jgi:hypothetical protein
MPQTLNVADLDFDTIKANLKSFMSTQTEWQDYDFEASGLSFLLDLLAYNTHYNAVLANFSINEAFLDTAAKRASIISHAKSLGYKPRGYGAARAKINFTINTLTLAQGQTAPASFVIPRGTVFAATVDNTVYTYCTLVEYSAVLSAGKYIFENIELAEGVYFAQEFLVTDNEHNPRYQLANPRADISTLSVMVKKSLTENEVNKWELSTRLLGMDENSKMYFVQESDDEKHEIYFGNGSIGKRPEVGNVLHVEYLSTNGVAGNGASIFTPISSISHEGRGLHTVETYTISTVQKATGGSQSEPIEDIRLNASSHFVTQDRAVTQGDYATLIRESFTNIRNMRVWGGEVNDPPQYGRVYVSIQPQYGEKLTELEKNQIRTAIASKAVANIQLEFADHAFLDIIPTISVYYDPTKVLVNQDLTAMVKQTVVNYNDTYLNTFDSVFRHSKFSNFVDRTSKAILSNITTIRLSKSFYPILGKSQTYQLNYLNPFTNMDAVVESTTFNVYGVSTAVKLTNIGNTLYIYYKNTYNRTVYVSTVGTIDFTAGIINISGLNIVNYAGTGGITITVRPLSNDVFSSKNVIARVPTDQLNLKMIAETQNQNGRIVTPS